LKWLRTRDSPDDYGLSVFLEGILRPGLEICKNTIFDWGTLDCFSFFLCLLWLPPRRQLRMFGRFVARAYLPIPFIVISFPGISKCTFISTVNSLVMVLLAESYPLANRCAWQLSRPNVTWEEPFDQK
jgi:hypothetical protein